MYIYFTVRGYQRRKYLGKIDFNVWGQTSLRGGRKGMERDRKGEVDGRGGPSVHPTPLRWITIFISVNMMKLNIATKYFSKSSDKFWSEYTGWFAGLYSI